MTCAEGAYGAQMPLGDMARELHRAMRHMKKHMAQPDSAWMAMAAAGPMGPGLGDPADAGPGRRGPHGHGRGRRNPFGGPGGPWGPGFPFGPGGPFGPEGPGQRGGRGRGKEGRRAGRGDVRLAILALLAEEPRHGYQLIHDISERSEGAWTPSPGSVYPALSALQDEGLIDDEKVDGKRVFSLTAAGREYVAAREAELAAVFAANAAEPEHEEVVDLRQLLFGVGSAAIAVMQGGTPDQRTAARDILNQARKDLYRILAEDDQQPSDPKPSDPSESEHGPV